MNKEKTENSRTDSEVGVEKLVMQREFRGFSKKEERWIKGYYYSECGNYYIFENRQIESELNLNTPYEVESNSVGQFIGLKDKNKKEKYEGDITKAEDGYIGEVIFKDGKFVEKYNNEYGYLYYDVTNYTGEIIGNIFENPELVA